MTPAPRVLVGAADVAACRALTELGYQVEAVPEVVLDHAVRLAQLPLARYPTVGAGLAHLIANPLQIVILNGKTIAEFLPRLRDGLPADSPARAELGELIEAQRDAAEASARIDAVLVALRESA